MKAAIVRAGVQDMRAVYEHNLTGIVGDYRYGYGICFGARESFRKDVRRRDAAEQAPVAVIVHLNYVDRA